MGVVWTGPDGWRVELIVLDDREILKVTHHGFWRAQVRTIADLKAVLAKHDLAPDDLEEVKPEDPDCELPSPPASRDIASGRDTSARRS
jgi:hypothetical protein